MKVHLIPIVKGISSLSFLTSKRLIALIAAAGGLSVATVKASGNDHSLSFSIIEQQQSLIRRRGSLPKLSVPPLSQAEKVALDLRQTALAAWQALRNTQEARYLYIQDAANLWSYVFTCPVEDQRLARDLSPVDRYAELLLASLVGTFFDEEWDTLETLDPIVREEAFLLIAKAVYAFEVGAQVTSSPTKRAIVDIQQRRLCQENQALYQDLFIATKRRAIIALKEGTTRSNQADQKP